MAETYYCLEQELHFTNTGAFELQKAWIAIGKKQLETKGMITLIDMLEKSNNRGQGNRAYDIDDSNEDFCSVEPLVCWLRVNEELRDEVWSKGNLYGLFSREVPVDFTDSWRDKLRLISEGIRKEINRV